MNAREMNGSPWRTRYFFVVALPLACITILIPLLAIPAISYLIRGFESFNTVIEWTLVSITFILFLAADIQSWTANLYSDTASTIWAVTFWIASISLLILGSILLAQLGSQAGVEHSGPLMLYSMVKLARRQMFHIVLWSLILACIMIGNLYKHAVELLPYLVFFNGKLWRFLRSLTRRWQRRTPTHEIETAS
ncbi:hypothetical protein EV356DRAFT_542534 [Viridothelium virens]|uniref:Uncharacterized protein n=1 Tax=Viridothelium virens TaxID=1048519 RepID=A0A6A6GSJ6_VIRVR|nr:hypothetical protein EV356DRAFT_542534 [Viridothelium virens]